MNAPCLGCNGFSAAINRPRMRRNILVPPAEFWYLRKSALQLTARSDIPLASVRRTMRTLSLCCAYAYSLRLNLTTNPHIVHQEIRSAKLDAIGPLLAFSYASTPQMRLHALSLRMYAVPLTMAPRENAWHPRANNTSTRIATKTTNQRFQNWSCRSNPCPAATNHRFNYASAPPLLPVDDAVLPWGQHSHALWRWRCRADNICKSACGCGRCAR